MIVEKRNDIYQNLKSYLVENSKYSPIVLNKAVRQSDKFPLVTLEELDNSLSFVTTRYKKQEVVSSLFYEINIYAVDIKTSKGTTSNVIITQELQKLVDDIMGIHFGLKRTSCRPTPNLDDTIRRITMKYEGKIFENRNRLF